MTVIASTAGIRILNREPVEVACIRYTGAFGEPLARFWRTRMGALLAEHGLVDCPRYGLPLDHPDVVAPDRCRYDACVQMPMGFALPGAALQTIPGGRYAVTHFRGKPADIAAAWSRLAAAALASAGSFDASRPAHEHYPRGAGFGSRTGEFSCELCLPVTN